MNDFDGAGQWRKPPVADGRPVPLANDQGFEEFVQEMCVDYAVNAEAVLEICAEYERRFGLGQADAEQGKQFMAWLEDALAVLVAYMDRQKDDPRFLRMTVDCFLLALGFNRQAHGENFTEVARELRLHQVFGQTGKQTVRECFEYLRVQLRLPPAAGQRGETGRENMRQSRLQRLQK